MTPETAKVFNDIVNNLLLCGVREEEIIIEETRISAQIGSVRIQPGNYFAVTINGGISLELANKIQNTRYPSILPESKTKILGFVVRVGGVYGGADPETQTEETLDGKSVCLSVRGDGKPYGETILALLRRDKSLVLLTPSEYEAAKDRIEKRVMGYHVDSLLGLKMFLDIIRSSQCR